MAEQAEEGWTERKSGMFIPTNSVTGEVRANKANKIPILSPSPVYSIISRYTRQCIIQLLYKHSASYIAEL